MIADRDNGMQLVLSVLIVTLSLGEVVLALTCFAFHSLLSHVFSTCVKIT